MEALVRYDSEIVVGILGGSAGTTLDAFQMLHDAKKYGARVALYGRKINNAEHQLTFIEYLRAIADGQIGPVEATKAYHGDLQKLGIRPKRSLEDDLQTTETATSYDAKKNDAPKKAEPAQKPRRSYFEQTEGPKTFEPLPDFSKMTQKEKLEWNLERIRRSM